MLTNLEALLALADVGTVTGAASKVHITQSAMSKRIANLENELGNKVIEREGRRVKFTPFGMQVVERVRPILGDLKNALITERSIEKGRIVVGISDSLLYTWGAQALAAMKKLEPRIEIDVQVHHADVIRERVRNGECMIAIVPGAGESDSDLVASTLFEVPMAIIPSGLKMFRLQKEGSIDLLTIRTHFDTWKLIERSLRIWSKEKGIELNPTKTFDNFLGVTHMAKAGFGHGLVPTAVAKAFNIPRKSLIVLQNPSVSYPVSLIGRSSTFSRQIVQDFEGSLRKALAKLAP